MTATDHAAPEQAVPETETAPDHVQATAPRRWTHELRRVLSRALLSAALVALGLWVLADFASAPNEAEAKPDPSASAPRIATDDAPAPAPAPLQLAEAYKPSAAEIARVAKVAPKRAPAPRRAPIRSAPAPKQAPRAEHAARIAKLISPEKPNQAAANGASTLGAFSIEKDGETGATAARPRGFLSSVVDALFGAPNIKDGGSDSTPPTKPRSGVVGYVLVDLDRRRVVDKRNADLALMPASVAKAPTALYALETLGADHRFVTRVLADGRIEDGVLHGDLYLVGSGDPVLDNDDLIALAQDLKKAGVDSVAGRFHYDASAGPRRFAIDPTQPPHAQYNAAVSGLNLNFNRVHLRWRRQGGRMLTTVSAVSRKLTLPVDIVEVDAYSGRGPGFEHRLIARLRGPGVREGDAEIWRIARRLMGSKGGRYLPVRRPAFYAATVFQAIAHREGVSLPEPTAKEAPSRARPLAAHESRPLKDIVRGMLKFSTNLTAEALGVAASRARGLKTPTLEASAAMMSRWMRNRYQLAGVDEDDVALKNHSGLTIESRLSARAMAYALTEAYRLQKPEDIAAGHTLDALLKPHRVKQVSKRHKVRAKTGTIYFGRGLSGYIECKGGKVFAFAYFNSDFEGRRAFDSRFDHASGMRPRSASGWLARARTVERSLLKRWTETKC